MAEAVNFVLEKANALLTVCLKYLAGPDKPGISSDDVQSLQSGIDNLTQKNTDQEKAVEAEGKQTDLVNQTVDRGHAIIMKTRNAGQAHYGKKNTVRNKEFHVGKEIKTVKGMNDELKYMKSVATDNKDDLAKHGFTSADIDEFDAVSQDLKTNSGNQKNAQTVQKAATADRNASMKNLQSVMFSIQKTAKVVFEKQPSVLVEFGSIHDSHGSGRKKPLPKGQATPSAKTKPPEK